MNFIIYKGGKEIGRVNELNIVMPYKEKYRPKDMLKAEIAERDIWTVSALYMLQYLDKGYTFMEY